MRDYEKFRRQREFRDAEMNQLKSSFAKILGLTKPNGEPNDQFSIKTSRLNEEQYRRWVIEMNTYNKQKGRWVDERIETMPQYFYKSEAKVIEEKKDRSDAKAIEDAKSSAEREVNKDEAPWNWPACNLWVFELENEGATHKQREPEQDFIGRMYDIHNH